MREQVIAARTTQMDRFKHNKKKIFTNSEMNVRDLDTYVPLSSGVKAVLVQAAGRLRLSARAYHRVIKIARTIADLAGSNDIQKNHVMEALQYRPKEKSL
ncbi:MAG: hypothetical protein Q8O83_04520 [bacterium]|nr:hypothetical protein [bacterium]